MNILPAIIIFSVAILTAWMLSLCFRSATPIHRFTTIDGLRGYLALGVVTHHAVIWYYYLRRGELKSLPSHFYTNLGEASVALFFMITGFLFWDKLLRGRTARIDWTRLYLSRFLRVVPMYLVLLILVLLTVGLVTRFHWQEPPGAVLKEIVRWLLFKVKTVPVFNHCDDTKFMAGMVWTLAYEWLFYLALPILALVIGAKPPPWLALASAALVVWIICDMIPDPLVLSAFLGGIAAATVTRLKLLPEFLQGKIGHLVVMAALIGAFTGFPGAFAFAPLALLALAFILIAHGTSVFGLFDWRVSRFLGQMTYSIYLLHGVILYWLFHFVLALKAPSHFQPAVFWLAVALCVPFILAISCLTYRAIELPAMNSLKKLLPPPPTKQFPNPDH